MSPFAAAASELIALGYHPLPIMPGEKRPGQYRGGSWQGMGDWQRFRDRILSDHELRLWTQHYPDANVGIVLGSSVVTQDGECLHVIAIDIDISDHDDLQSVIRQLPFTPMRKRGAKGETLFYLADKDIKSRPYSRASDRVRLVDVLTGFDARQTVCPPSRHPSGVTYEWTAGPVCAADLPIFNAGHLECLEEVLYGLGWDPQAERSAPVARITAEGVAPDEDDFFSETKRTALMRLDAWVPGLDLTGCRRARGGYEAVATWRPSSTGQPIERRKRNLSIQPNGITDFGDGPRGYSAIDLVMAARGCEQAEATGWLRQVLGLSEAGVVIDLRPRERATVEPSAIVASPVVHDELPDALTRVPGLLGELTDWICDTARRPQRGLALGAALTILGTAAGRKYAGPTYSGTHLYVLALARTGAGKDHALKQIARILNACDMSRHIGPAQFMSWQAMVNDLTNQPLMVCPMDEFGAFMTRINQRSGGSNNERGMSAIFRTAWGTSFDTMPAISWAGKEGQAIHSPALSVYGASVHEEFYRSLSGVDVSNGFLNRFLLISTRKKSAEREPKLDRFKVPDRIRASLMAIYGSGSALVRATANNGQADAPLFVAEWETPEAQALYKAFYATCEDMEELQPLWGRTAEMSLRLATIRAVGSDRARPLISMANMQWGIDLAKWSADRMIAETADHLADTPFQAEAQRVLRKIKERGRISQRDLTRALGVQTKKRDLEEVLQTLTEAGLIAYEKATPPAGGPPTVWWWAT